MNKATLETTIRNNILAIVSKAIETELNTDALAVSASEIALPVVDAEGNEKFAIVKVSIPRGTRNGNGYDAYDGYAAAEEYKAEQEEKAAKKAASEAKKEAKAKAREARREAKKVVKELNEKGLDKMIKGEWSPFFIITLTR